MNSRETSTSASLPITAVLPAKSAATAIPQAAGHVWWYPLIDFLIHVSVGTGIFVLISVPAVVLNFFVEWLLKKGISELLYGFLVSGEYMLITADLLLFGIFLFKTSIRTAKAL